MRPLRGMLGWLSAVLLLLVGCDASSTPVPAVVPPTVTPVPAVDNTQPPPLRYGLSPLLQDNLDETTLQSLREIALVEAWTPSDDPAAYDIVAAYGREEGWEVAPTGHDLILLFNQSLSPLDNASMATTIQRALDTQQLADATGITGVVPGANAIDREVSLRAELANMGYPDGFELVLAHTHALTLDSLQAQLAAVNIDSRTVLIDITDVPDVLDNNRAHLVLALTASQDQLAALRESMYSAQLYVLPIRYIARDDLTLTFTPQGLPVPAQ